MQDARSTRRISNFEFRISDFGFDVPQPISSAGIPQSAWRCCGCSPDVPLLTILGAQMIDASGCIWSKHRQRGHSRAMPPRRIGGFKPEGPLRNVPLLARDGRVSRAAAEARSDSAMGGEAATPTSGAEGLNHAPQNRSVAEVSRSRRDWASGCVYPTGATEGQTVRSSRRVEGGKRG